MQDYDHWQWLRVGIPAWGLGPGPLHPSWQHAQAHWPACLRRGQGCP